MLSVSGPVPRVSIVVIGYNDAEHLPAALRSAQAQTLRDIEIVVVDDASTDATADVISSFAARDRRIQPHRLTANSGGCSRPRNTGLAHATGEFVLFLDSDDVLPRRAVERLYRAATRADADVTCGRMVRRHHHPRRHLPSNDDLYRRTEVLDGVLARPAQLRDTPACGKLFRREFLDRMWLRFPDGLLFEDLLFTTTAYAAARRIAIVTGLTYIWNVRRQQPAPSITNRRELRNWQDRFEIHRRIDADLASRPRARELRTAKDHKFLTVDWPIYLRDLRAFPADRRKELLDVAADYLARVALHERTDVPPGLRVACYLAARRDLEATLTAADFVTTGGVGTDLVVADERLYWTGRHLDEPDGRAALDVTATGVLTARFESTPFLAVVSRAHADGGRLGLSGHVHDVLGRLADGDVTASVRVAGRLGGPFGDRVLDCPVTTARSKAVVSFATEVDLPALAHRLHPGVGHELRLDLLLRRGEALCRVPLTARDAVLPADPLALPNRWSTLLGASVAVQERNGRLVLDLLGLNSAVDRAFDLASRGRNAAGRSRLRRQRTAPD
jgi:CDP-glycerol glycerophosphotransferase